MFVKMIYWNKKLPTKFSSCNVQRSGEHIWRRNHAVSSSVPGPRNLPPCHWCIFHGCRQGTIWRSSSDVAAFLVNRRSCPSHGLCSDSSALNLLLWSLANFLHLYFLWVCPRSLHWRGIQSFSPQQPDLSPGKELRLDSNLVKNKSNDIIVEQTNDYFPTFDRKAQAPRATLVTVSFVWTTKRPPQLFFSKHLPSKVWFHQTSAFHC